MAKYAISSSGEASLRQLASDIKCFSASNLEAGRRLKEVTMFVGAGNLIGCYSGNNYTDPKFSYS